MSDDEDYMSDKFLQGSEKDVAPSLLYRHADRREFELMKKKAEQREQRKPKHVIEREKREEGLSSAIESSNKGFEMLMKMGYKPGQGIGKSAKGIVEPIGIELKSNRQGLGKGTKISQPKKKSTEAKVNMSHLNDFRSRIAQEKLEKKLQADLRRSKKICQQLDTEKSIKEPVELWFWPEVEIEKNDNEEESEEEGKHEEKQEEEPETLDMNEQLEILTKYLRDKHFYCIWCSTAYNDEHDLRDNCPGNTRIDH